MSRASSCNRNQSDTLLDGDVELIDLGDFYPVSAYSDERIRMFLARDLRFGSTNPDEDEFLNVVKMPFDELYDMVMRGEIRDAKTQITLLMAKNLI